MKNPLVSIVVPIYNVEKYLETCLASIVSQTLKNIEIICVDDGSTDNSLNIAKRFASKDDRIKVISKPNSGYGHTMNVGFNEAKGEYVGIVESDDYIDKNMFKYLYTKAKKYNLDISRSDFFEFSQTFHNYVMSVNDISYYDRLLKPIDTPIIFDFRMNTWASIYKLSFLKENNIKHNTTPGASFQDTGFWFQTYLYASSLMIFNKAFYHYRQDNINSSINSKEKSNCIIEEFKFIENKIKGSKFDNNSLINVFIRSKYFHYLYNFYRINPTLRESFLKIFSDEFKNVNIKDLNLNKMEIERLSLIINDYSNFLAQNKDITIQQYCDANKKYFSSKENIIKRVFSTLKKYGVKGLFTKLKIKLRNKQKTE